MALVSLPAVSGQKLRRCEWETLSTQEELDGKRIEWRTRWVDESVSEVYDTLARNRNQKPTSENPAPIADANILVTSAQFWGRNYRVFLGVKTPLK